MNEPSGPRAPPDASAGSEQTLTGPASDDRTLRSGGATGAPAAGEDATPTLVRDAEATLRQAPRHEPGSGGDEVTPEFEGRYQLRGEYGRGGQSRVLLAFDAHVGREIALKELLPEAPGASPPRSLSQAASSRFLREARITGQLEHPNIVPVYELGRHADGTLYYTQKLVRGRTFKKALREAKDAAGRLELLAHFADVCHAVAYAHSRGVIHRDLKPDNVMVGQFGETVVLDWGLAKARGQKDVRGQELEAEALRMRTRDATLAGHALGTPAYMSPEQAAGKLDEIDERSDVWSLGVVLFEILTGRLPFEGSSAYSVIGKVLNDRVPRVREVRRDAPPELAAVAERAMSRDKAQRYANAEELAHEIDAFQAGGNVRAYQYSSLELLRRFVRRNRALSAVSAAAVLVVLLAAAALAVEVREARRNLARALVEKARAAEGDYLWGRAAVYYAAARVQDDLPEARWGALVDWREAVRLSRLPGHWSWVPAAAFTPGGDALVTASWDHTLGIFDLASSRRTRALPGGAALALTLALAPDGRTAAVAHDDGAIALVDLASGAELSRLQGGRDQRQPSFSRDGARLVLADEEGVRVLRVEGGRALVPEALHPGVSASFGPGGELAVAGGAAGTLTILGAGAPRSARVSIGEVTCALWSPDGSRVAVAGSDREIRFFDPATLAQTGALNAAASRGCAIAFSPDGRQLALSGESAVRVVDVATREEVLRVRRPQTAWMSAFSPDGASLVIAERSTEPVVVGLGRRFNGHAGPVAGASFAPDSRTLATVGRDRTLRLWDSATGAELARHPLPGPGDDVRHLGARVAVRTREPDALFLLDAATGQESWRGPPPLAGTPFSRSGRRYAAALEGGRVGVVAVDSGAAQPVPATPDCAGDFSADEALLFLLCGDGTLRELEIRTGATLRTVKLAGAWLRVSPDGRTVAVATQNRVELRDARTLAPVRLLGPLPAEVRQVDFSPDGALLAGGGIDGTVRLWDLATGAIVAQAALPFATLALPAFSPDGRALAVRTPGGSGSTLSLVRLGAPATLPPPAQHLAEVLARTGLRFDGAEVLAAPEP